ncbi:AAA ATPase-like domain-containing protein [Desulfonema limicola]|uniref:AAA ATPase-like domain-containing protein n=1 Tax=Desulfonema limicola TaxID=45656 RepID=A0A975B8W3_9BACT|nr:AAA family ATPase [Desulfonema limicola]QTA80822.1 AAA ATPase-like domain-containing protein [Desulfonema limicola]
MKFNFEKLGYIDKGSLELGDLTLICGPNNVGKTYVSYCIYGFIRHFKRLVDLSISNEQIEILKNEGSLQIDLNQYRKNLPEYLKNALKKFSQTLTDYFSAPDEYFTKTKVNFSYDKFPVDLTQEFKRKINFGQGETLLFDKAPGETMLTAAMQVTEKSRLPSRILEDVVGEVIADCLFSGTLPKPFAITSERTGIALFYKELDLTKNAILEHLTKSDKPNPIELLNSMRARYARPIQDNIDAVRDYDILSKRKSFIREHRQKYKPILDLLHDILGGTFKTVDKQVLYYPKKERNRDQAVIPVYLASSSVKSLFLIDLYINCLAQKHDLLVIDEPELNLHPDNQRKMAGLLTRLVNAGLKIMVTTHSDYIIKEFNNRIMLNNEIDNKQELMKSHNMVQEDILSPGKVKAFILKNDHSIKDVKVDRYGILYG